MLKRYDQPDEVRTFEKGRLELVTVGGMTIGRATYEPGWKWSRQLGRRQRAVRVPALSGRRGVHEEMTLRILIRRAAAVAAATVGGALMLHAQQRIYWADEVPAGWTGTWPAELQTIPERTAYARTMTSLQLLEWITALKAKTDRLHVVNMFTSPMRKVAPAMVLSNPRVTSAQQARTSGKPVVFLFGNIHPPEPEAAEALLMVARDLTVGSRKHLLDNQIVIIAPIFNVDGTDTLVTQDGSLGSETPHILGVRENAGGLDLNRDAVKLQTIEANGLYRLLNEWDPVLLLDGHLMSRVTHGYANTYGTTTVPAAAPGPRDYTHDTLFPAVREKVRKEFGLEVFTHALFTPNTWPPTAWSHDRAAWTVEAKFIVNDYGLRNRLAIITETPGQPTFEKRIYAQYAYISALLDYTNAHAKQIQSVVKAADDKTVADVQAQAEAGHAAQLARRQVRVARQDRRLRLSLERRRVQAGDQHPRHAARHGVRPARARERGRPDEAGRNARRRRAARVRLSGGDGRIWPPSCAHTTSACRRSRSRCAWKVKRF